MQNPAFFIDLYYTIDAFYIIICQLISQSFLSLITYIIAYKISTNKS